MKDYYEILGVKSNASLDDIKKAHNQLAKKYHPDKKKTPGGADEFIEIREARDVLSDSENKKIYDLLLDFQNRLNLILAKSESASADLISVVLKIKRAIDETKLGKNEKENYQLIFNGLMVKLSLLKKQDRVKASPAHRDFSREIIKTLADAKKIVKEAEGFFAKTNSEDDEGRYDIFYKIFSVLSELVRWKFKPNTVLSYSNAEMDVIMDLQSIITQLNQKPWDVNELKYEYTLPHGGFIKHAKQTEWQTEALCQLISWQVITPNLPLSKKETVKTWLNSALQEKNFPFIKSQLEKFKNKLEQSAAVSAENRGAKRAHEERDVLQEKGAPKKRQKTTPAETVPEIPWVFYPRREKNPIPSENQNTVTSSNSIHKPPDRVVEDEDPWKEVIDGLPELQQDEDPWGAFIQTLRT